LGSTVLTTSSANATHNYYAYGRVRNYSGSFPTRHQFTGQYVDDTGLVLLWSEVLRPRDRRVHLAGQANRRAFGQ
jgi:hypothetical protein